MQFFGYGCCRFDDWKAIYRGSISVDRCKLICLQDADCIAADVAREYEDTGRYDCYTFSGVGTNFRTECNTYDHADNDERCYRKARSTI